MVIVSARSLASAFLPSFGSGFEERSMPLVRYLKGRGGTAAAGSLSSSPRRRELRISDDEGARRR